MIRYILTILFFSGISVLSLGQKPDPVSIDKVSGSMSELISIHGTGFGGDLTKIVVFFGAAKGVVETVSDQLIEVHAPPGATYENISVTNLTSGLTGYTRQHFLLSFGGDFGFDPNNLTGQSDFSSASGLYDQCLCDFDGDTHVDIATSHDNSSPVSTTISILTNTSTGPNNINFTTASISLAARSIHLKCGDLNSDGKADLVVSEGGIGDRIFIFQNNSGGSISFMAPQIIKLAGTKTKQVQIADVDLDGKPEIIVTDQGSNTISILTNQSAGPISFSSTPIVVKPTGAVSSDGLAVEDINGDDRPEIVVSQFLTASSNIFIAENKSIPGTISFGDIKTLTISGSVVDLKVGDLDGDRKPEIAATQLLTSGISVFLNTSTPTAISFAAPKTLSTDDRPWGIDFGDLDGDGRTDIAVASVFKKSITILNNISSAGNLDFQRHIKTTTFINRHINIGDLDGDGKPDVAFTSIDDNNNGIPASKVSVFRNKTCMIPKITPAGPLTICTGFPLRLFATASTGTTYDWKLNGVTQVSGSNPFFDVTLGGVYTVTAIAEGGTCSKVSNSVTVNVGAGTASGPATPTNNGPVCAGNTLTLTVNNVSATQYLWSGPAGYTGSGLTPSPIANFQLANSGRYFVDILVGTCLAQRTSTVVEIIDLPNFQVGYSGGDVICQGDNKTLSVVPNPVGFTYQWFKDGGPIGGATLPTFVASTGGEYSVKAKYTLSAGCQEVESPKLKLTVVTLPVAAFTAPASACSSQKVEFTNQSTSDGAVPTFYNWDFGDANSSTDKDPTHIFTAVNTFTVKLTVSYNGNACSDEATQSITVTAAPPVSITNPDNKYKFCEGDSVKLEVLGPFTSYSWSTSETSPFIYAKEGGIISVDVEATNGCILTANRELITDPAPAVIVTATPPQINEGETSQLEALGLTDYLWSPPESLMGDATIPNPIAKPLVTTTYTVEGKNGGVGCTGRASIEVVVKGEPIVNKLKPGNFFSPNEDGKNDTWGVDKIQDFQQCGVTVYDDKGVKVFEAKPYQNNWDGSFNGRKLPDGVYYYIIRCDGEESKPRTGSITVLR